MATKKSRPYADRSDAEKASTIRCATEYNKKHTKMIGVRFTENEYGLYDHVKAQGNIQAYIKRLISADMEGGA